MDNGRLIAIDTDYPFRSALLRLKREEAFIAANSKTDFPAKREGSINERNFSSDFDTPGRSL
jgi:hypothetical protein